MRMRLLVCCTLVWLSSTVAGQTMNTPWRSLQYTLNYGPASANASLRLENVAASHAAQHWLSPADTRPLQPDSDRLWHLHVDNRFGSHRETIDSWLDPGNLRAYQRDRLSSGKQSRLKRYRYLRQGVFRARSEADGQQASQAPDSWPVTSALNFRAPEEIRERVAITTPYGVLLAASLAPLRAVGDTHTLYVYTDIDYLQIDLKVIGRKAIDTDYQLDGGRQSGRIDALKIALQVKPLGDKPAHDEFSLFGLEGDISILLDPDNRLPLELEGQLPKFGTQSIKLQQASIGSIATAP